MPEHRDPMLDVQELHGMKTPEPEPPEPEPEQKPDPYTYVAIRDVDPKEVFPGTIQAVGPFEREEDIDIPADAIGQWTFYRGKRDSKGRLPKNWTGFHRFNRGRKEPEFNDRKLKL